MRWKDWTSLTPDKSHYLVKGASNLMQRLSRLPPAPNVTLLDRRKPKSLSWPHANHLYTADLHQMVLHRPVECTALIGTYGASP
jgi:hypothetical protein